MDWLKKWFSSSDGDSEVRTDHSETSRKDLQTRMTYKYPERDLILPPSKKTEERNGDLPERRPLAASRLSQGETNRRNVRSYKDIHYTYTPENEFRGRNGREEGPNPPEIPIRKKKKPFTSTAIPSPIYGYRTNTPEKQPPIEFELAPFEQLRPVQRETEPNVFGHTESFETNIPNFESGKEETEIRTAYSEHSGNFESVGKKAPELEDRVEEKGIGEFLYDEGKEKDNIITGRIGNGKGEESPTEITPFKKTNEADEHKMVRETAESSPPFEGKTEKDRLSIPDDSTGNKKRTVPFNVLMLKKDREMFRKRMEREAEKVEGMEPFTYGRENLNRSYSFPPRHLLKEPVKHFSNPDWINEQVAVLNQTFRSFHVAAKVVSTSEGPSVTRFEISPQMGVKVNKITNLTDDLKLSLAAKEIRIEAPIPGKHTVGIEVPNRKRRPVHLREIIDQPDYIQAPSPLTVAVGLDIAGKPVVTDLKKMPHGLIAGATGSGKSVCINTFIVSLLYKARPDEVKLLLIDPKMVELAPYNGIPHLISPVITDVKAATQALKWAVDEMERRYERFAEMGVRDIDRFNERGGEKLPFIVIVIDELADLMMVAPTDVEDAICRIAQKARACGIHLLIATQRPSVDVITGLIKANVPTRIAFSVSSQVDSRTIIDMSGAERLLGKGDMLFLANGTSKPVRLQGPFISDEEIEAVVNHVQSQGEPEYLFKEDELIKKSDMDDRDELLLEACGFAVENGNISTSSLQRRFRIGYNRAARLMELMEEKGIISEQRGSKPRDVLITETDLQQMKEYL